MNALILAALFDLGAADTSTMTTDNLVMSASNSASSLYYKSGEPSPSGKYPGGDLIIGNYPKSSVSLQLSGETGAANFLDANGKAILSLDRDGTISVHGKRATSDKQVTRAFRVWLCAVTKACR